MSHILISEEKSIGSIPNNSDLFQNSLASQELKSQGWEILFEFEPISKEISKDLISDYQHYFPQFYFKKFYADPNDKNKKSYCFNIEKPESESKLRNSDRFGGFNGFLSFVNKNNQIVNDIDSKFSKVESDFAIVLEEKLNKSIPLNPEEHKTMCRFLALMHLRTPKSFNFFEEKIQDSIIEMSNDEKILALTTSLGKALWNKFESVEQIVNYENKKITQVLRVRKEQATHLYFMNLWDITEKAFIERDYHIAEFDQPILITSDHPCASWHPEGKDINGYGALGNPDTEVYFPLSPTKCLVLLSKQVNSNIPFIITPEMSKIHNLDDHINYTMLRTATKYIVSHKKFLNLDDLCKKLDIRKP